MRVQMQVLALVKLLHGPVAPQPLQLRLAWVMAGGLEAVCDHQVAACKAQVLAWIRTGVQLSLKDACWELSQAGIHFTRARHSSMADVLPALPLASIAPGQHLTCMIKMICSFVRVCEAPACFSLDRLSSGCAWLLLLLLLVNGELQLLPELLIACLQALRPVSCGLDAACQWCHYCLPEAPAQMRLGMCTILLRVVLLCRFSDIQLYTSVELRLTWPL